jgi:hypothetical protein
MVVLSDQCFARPNSIQSPEDHAAVLHRGGAGRVTIARKQGAAWRETSVPVTDVAYTVRQLDGLDDVYITQNRFHGPRRLVTRLAELDALFVDLDYYRTMDALTHP